MNAHLPPHWTWARLGDVARIDSELVDPAEHESYPHIAPNHIESWTGMLLTVGTVGGDGVKSPKYLFRPGQVLFSKIRPYLAKAVVVDFDGLCSADMYPITTEIEPLYLHRWLIHPDFIASTIQHQGRTVLPKINREQLLQLPIPVPPLTEQRRIIARLSSLLARTQIVRRELGIASTWLAQLRENVLSAAFSGALTYSWREKHSGLVHANELLKGIRAERRRKEEALRCDRGTGKVGNKEPELADSADLRELPRNWTWTTLAEIRDLGPNSMTDGPFGSKLKTEDYVAKGIRVIRLGNIGIGEFLSEDRCFVSREKYEELRKHEVFAGDLVIAALAEPVARAAMIPSDLGTAIVKADCIRLKVHPSLSNRFIMHALNSPGARLRAERSAHGIGRLRINMEDMRKLPIPLAPRSEQTVIYERIDVAFSQMNRLRLLLREMDQELTNLDRAILAQAYRGDLVPQDPNDEPASALLERIRTNRKAVEASRPKGGARQAG